MSGPESAEQVVGLLIEQPADATRARDLVTRMVASGGAETAESVCARAAASLSEDDEACAGRAAELLSWLGPIAVEPLLEALSRSQRAPVPMIAALARLGDLRAGDALLRLLEDADPQVRAAAAQALGQIADPAGAQALAAACHDPDRDVRAAALDAIRRLGPLAMLPDPVRGETVPTGQPAPSEDESGWQAARRSARFRSSSG